MSEPNEPMHEPMSITTKVQSCHFQRAFTSPELLQLIARASTKAHNAALERLILMISASARFSNFPREYLLQILTEMKEPT